MLVETSVHVAFVPLELVEEELVTEHVAFPVVTHPLDEEDDDEDEDEDDEDEDDDEDDEDEDEALEGELEVHPLVDVFSMAHTTLEPADPDPGKSNKDDAIPSTPILT